MEIVGVVLICFGIVLVLYLSKGGEAFSMADGGGCGMWALLVLLMPGLIFILIGIIVLAVAINKKKDGDSSTDRTIVLPKDAVIIEDDSQQNNAISEIKQLRITDHESARDEKFSVPDEIRKYKALQDDGIITEEEFEKKKQELLGGVPYAKQSVQEFNQKNDMASDLNRINEVQNAEKEEIGTDGKCCICGIKVGSGEMKEWKNNGVNIRSCEDCSRLISILNNELSSERKKVGAKQELVELLEEGKVNQKAESYVRELVGM